MGVNERGRGARYSRACGGNKFRNWMLRSDLAEGENMEKRYVMDNYDGKSCCVIGLSAVQYGSGNMAGVFHTLFSYKHLRCLGSRSACFTAEKREHCGRMENGGK